MLIANGKIDGTALASRWWMLVVRGLAAIVFGALTLALPSISLLALVFIWGGYAFVDGILGIAVAARAGREGRHWGWHFFEAIVSLGAAATTLLWPGITAMALLMLIAVWAVITGTAEIVAAVELRHVIRGEWLLALSGVLSIAFGVLMMVFPRAGALAVVSIIGLYALLFGVVLCGLGFRIHHWATHGDHPLTGTPSHA